MAVASEAIRSVTHLVLALDGTNALTSISNRKERDGCPTPSGSVFLGQLSHTPALPKEQAGSALVPRPIPVSQDPENFQCRAVFIQYLRALVPPNVCALGPTRF